MAKVRMLNTAYEREGYLFECLQMEYFGSLLTIVGDSETVQEAVERAKAKRINGEPLCRVYKLDEDYK